MRLEKLPFIELIDTASNVDTPVIYVVDTYKEVIDDTDKVDTNKELVTIEENFASSPLI